MIIRKGKPEDMKGVLALIQELADFEKEPDAVVITEDDLIRDGFGTHPLFHVFVAEVDDNIVGKALLVKGQLCSAAIYYIILGEEVFKNYFSAVSDFFSIKTGKHCRQ